MFALYNQRQCRDSARWGSWGMLIWGVFKLPKCLEKRCICKSEALKRSLSWGPESKTQTSGRQKAAKARSEMSTRTPRDTKPGAAHKRARRHTYGESKTNRNRLALGVAQGAGVSFTENDMKQTGVLGSQDLEPWNLRGMEPRRPSRLLP